MNASRRALRALIVGEALMDIVVRPAGFEEHIGGSALNVAVASARLTDRPTLLTSLGRDGRGDAIIDYLRLNAVDLAPAPRGPTTSTAVAKLAGDGSASYEFDLRWPAAADPGGEFDVVHVGSIGLFLAPGDASVREIVSRRRPGSLVTLDPNVRPSIVGHHARALTRFEQIAQLADVVKMSDEDAAWLYPGSSVDAVLDHMLDLGARLAVVTRGRSGSVLASTRARVAVAGQEVVPVDTIGAGDAYMAALIHQLRVDHRATIREGGAFGSDVLRRIGGFASRVAGITVSRRGANPPTLAEVVAVDLSSSVRHVSGA